MLDNKVVWFVKTLKVAVQVLDNDTLYSIIKVSF